MNIFNFYSSQTGRWAFGTDFKNYKDYEHLFDQGGSEYSSTSLTNHGKQHDLELKDTQALVPEIKNILKQCFNQLNAPIEILEFKRAWHITYFENGYQCMHHHQSQQSSNTTTHILSTVIFFDTIPYNNGNYNGCLYGLIPESDGYQHYAIYPSEEGKIIVMDGKVWHGVYHTDRKRRSLICDFEYRYIN